MFLLRLHHAFLLSMVLPFLVTILLVSQSLTHKGQAQRDNDAVLPSYHEVLTLTTTNKSLGNSSMTISTNNTRKTDSDEQWGTLQCDDDSNGNHDDDAQLDASEMVYWKGYNEPPPVSLGYHKDDQDDKFITFEMDEGGWNNVRMAFETVVALALATGRILVLPPKQKMFLLDDTPAIGFDDFFPLNDNNSDSDMIAPLQVWSFQQFLQWRVGQNHSIPFNRTHWDGATPEDIQRLNNWARQQFVTPPWHPLRCAVFFPAHNSNHTNKNASLPTLDLGPKTFKRKDEKAFMTRYRGKPTPVDGSLQDRVREVLSYHRNELCHYHHSHTDHFVHDSDVHVDLKQQQVLHFRGSGSYRLLVHFYAFVIFEDWRLDLWLKRFIRDRLRYVDRLQCVAARIVQKLRNTNKNNNTNNNKTKYVGEDDFAAIHVRRGDFKNTKTNNIPAQDIYNHTLRKYLPPEEKLSTLYIATMDSPQEDPYYKIFYEHYQVHHLSQQDQQQHSYFQDELKDISRDLYGIVDQLVAARASVFVGCYFSTFSGYINRLRGYHSQRQRKGSGWKEGALPTSWYYAPLYRANVYQTYFPIVRPMTSQEFALGWRNIDAINGEQRQTTTTTAS